MAQHTVFVTGGAGYIGSHCIVSLLEAGYDVVAIDNFVNSVSERGNDGQPRAPALERVKQITGKDVTFVQCDLLDIDDLRNVFKMKKIHSVIHFAAIKAVGESMLQPFLYYRNNMMGAINLLEVMKENGCYNLVFSSSCTVYGSPEFLPITEEHPTGKVTNVYGRTKFFVEEMLKDVSVAEKQWNIIMLRYFNPVGAHPSGIIGEDPTKPFTNLMPYIAQVAIGGRDKLTIFGDDYKTDDGTGVRDYIHIMDLASGHVAALKKLQQEHSGIKIYNLGTGEGVSVMRLVKTFEKVTGTKVPFEILQRRQGDIDAIYARCELAEKELNWKAKYSLEQMCEDFWRWQTMNPDGYRSSNIISNKTSNGESNVASSVQATNGTNGVHA
ncbi:UDP-glucose 4-epimerase-like [Neocloeon triangulifer]|uniref:UDP-glucose 4-epimerase-like n=1 Tax=Neocloeon triangulifer TaxID=2078957 RepID=UPI00286EFC7A|nr:UDP-glucose 4-epimerase-like [Neocloeon triangulifer]XP_059480376.1 UDP-glucose 4-epimerase-like [Neocloeon triangulifer]